MSYGLAAVASAALLAAFGPVSIVSWPFTIGGAVSVNLQFRRHTQRIDALERAGETAQALIDELELADETARARVEELERSAERAQVATNLFLHQNYR